jgi:hypothetical protein
MRTAFLVEGNPLRSRNGRGINLPASEAQVDHAVHAAAACGTVGTVWHLSAAHRNSPFQNAQELAIADQGAGQLE